VSLFNYENVADFFPKALCLIDIEGNVLECNKLANKFLDLKNLETKKNTEKNILSFISKNKIELDSLILRTRKVQDSVKVVMQITNGDKHVKCRCDFLFLRSDTKEKKLFFSWEAQDNTLSSFSLLNNEIEELRSQYHDVREQRNNLKEYVRERTKELEETNGMLSAAQQELELHRDSLLELVEERTAELKNSTEAALKAKEAAISANQAKTNFLSNISHELRTPMHAILSYSKFGVDKIDKIDKTKTVEYFTHILSSGERLLKLINGILDIAGMESGKIIMVFKEHDVMKVLQQCAAELEVLRAKKKITFNIIQSATSTLVDIDEERINQVMINVLGNAIKFTSEGTKIEACFSDADLVIKGKNVKALKISIKDEGIGIPESELERIFDQFVQSSATATGAGGTGLGLSISKSIVGEHLGKIWASNNAGLGATISILLPYKKIQI